jgi:hypothetical protein
MLKLKIAYKQGGNMVSDFDLFSLFRFLLSSFRLMKWLKSPTSLLCFKSSSMPGNH